MRDEMCSRFVRTIMVLGLASTLAGCVAGARDTAEAPGADPAREPVSASDPAGAADPAGGYQLDEGYRVRRDYVFDLRPEDIGVSAERPLAVMVETGHEPGIATVLAVADGAVSMYLSNGGGVIGAGEHEKVRTVGEAFLREATSFAGRMTPTTDRALPARGRVRFYLVSADGVRTVEASEDDLRGGRHELSPLFLSSYRLIAAIHEQTGKTAPR